MILLDTNAVYWGITGDGQLGSRAQQLLAKSAARYVSSITLVEFTIKEMTGKLGLPDDLPAKLVDIGLDSLAYTERHAQGLRLFPDLVGHDPFGRMLLAQAVVEGFQFLTSDRKLLALDKPWIIDATQ